MVSTGLATLVVYKMAQSVVSTQCDDEHGLGVNSSHSKTLNGNATFRNKVSVVLGAQWGDEGKGKIVDLLCQRADIVCRCQVIFAGGKVI